MVPPGFGIGCRRQNFHIILYKISLDKNFAKPSCYLWYSNFCLLYYGTLSTAKNFIDGAGSIATPMSSNQSLFSRLVSAITPAADKTRHPAKTSKTAPRTRPSSIKTPGTMYIRVAYLREGRRREREIYIYRMGEGGRVRAREREHTYMYMYMFM